MPHALSRHAASRPARTSRSRRLASAVFLFAMLPSAARAIIVRGHATDAIGQPVAGARVQLIVGSSVVATAVADAYGFFEARTASAGRYKIVATAANYLPALGDEFYGGALDIIEHDVVLSGSTVQQEISVAATGLPTPVPQLTAPVSTILGTAFSPRLGVVEELRQTPGVFLVQTGQTGSLTALFLRGGNSTANLVLVDGIPAEDVGGTFDFGTVSSTGVGRIEVDRGPDSAIHGTDAGAGVVTIETPRGTSTGRPLLTYSGDAGNLHAWRNEVTVGGTRRKLDYFAGLSRLDTSNALQLDRYHSVTSVGNVGYAFGGNTDLRFTIRNADSVEGLPGPHDFYGISQNGREGDQDIYSGATLEHTSAENWHNLVRYGIARKREQAQYFNNVGTLETFYPGTSYSFSEFYGNVVTIRGANGYTASGQTAFLNMAGNHYDQDSNRDQLYYQSDWSPSRHFNALLGFRYDNERGSFNQTSYFAGSPSSSHEITQRTNFEYNLQFQGEYFGRLEYSLGGAVEKNHLYGIAGTPRLGLAYSPVRPGSGLFHGTRLRGNVATGVQEPTLALESFSLYDTVLKYNPADIARYGIAPPQAERSRTYDVGVDQDIFGEKLILKVNYFHNVFDRQLEAVSGTSLGTYFGIHDSKLTYTTQYLNSQAYRAQGEELELDWQALHRVAVRGGYTHLDARVLQSFATDAVDANQGKPNTNPTLPGIPIGFESPLVGARPFRRAPNTGFATVTYTGDRWSATLKSALASRSDDSTFLDGFDLNFGNSLVLPNHNLDFGYVKLDLSGTYEVYKHTTLFTQMDNLLNDQHIGPIGYPGLPFTVRVGVKLRLGGE